LIRQDTFGLLSKFILNGYLASFAFGGFLEIFNQDVWKRDFRFLFLAALSMSAALTVSSAWRKK
jgi:hypothetical protein